jgi:hypothetical protein
MEIRTSDQQFRVVMVEHDHDLVGGMDAQSYSGYVHGCSFEREITALESAFAGARLIGSDMGGVGGEIVADYLLCEDQLPTAAAPVYGFVDLVVR